MRRGQVNLKFVLVIGMVVLSVVGTGGFLFALSYMKDAGRNIAQGDKFFEQGELRKAYDYYGRAVAKDLGNEEYLAKLKKTLLLIQPTTRSDARELYNTYRSILQTASDQRPRDIESHKRLVDEVHRLGRVRGGIDVWQMVERRAQNMADRIDPNDEAIWFARGHLGFARQRMALTRDETEAAIEELIVVTENDPTNDLAWRGLIAARMKLASDIESTLGRESAADYYNEVDIAVTHAMESCPNGPEVACIVAFRLLADRQQESRERAIADGDLDAPYNTTDEELREAAEHLVTTLEGVENMGLVLESQRFLVEMRSINGRDYADRIMSSYLEIDPTNDYIRVQLARLKYGLQEFDEATELAEQVITAEDMTVSMLAEFQPRLRQEGAALLSDIAIRKWLRTPERNTEEREEHLAEAKAAYDRLFSLTDNPDDDLLVQTARAKMAFLEGRYTQSAVIFDKIDREEGIAVAEDLIVYSRALRQLNQDGTAYDMLVKAQQRAPGNPNILVEMAMSLIDRNRYDQAETILLAILDRLPDFEQAQQVYDVLIARRNLEQGIYSDPVQEMFVQVARLTADREFEKALEILEPAYEEYGETRDSVAAAFGLLLIDMGQEERATQVVMKGLEDHPDSRPLNELRIRLSNDQDPVRSLIAYWESEEGTPRLERLVRLCIGLGQIAQNHQRIADSINDPSQAERRAALLDIASRARSESERFYDELMALDPNDPNVLELRFQYALNKDDREAAQRIVDIVEQTSSNDADPLFYAGRLHVHFEEYQQAIPAIEQALTINPVSATGWLGLGQCYRAVGRMEDAENAFGEAYERTPDDPQTVRDYASVLLRLGKPETAMTLLESAMVTMPDNPAIREMLFTAKAESGLVADVLSTRQQIFRERPGDLENAVALLRLLGRTRPTPDLITNPRTNRPFSSAQWASLGPSERRENMDRGQSALDTQAREVLEQIGSRLGDTLRFAAMEAEYLRLRGRVNEGLERLESWVANNEPAGGELVGVLAIAQYLSRINRFEDAIALLEESRHVQSDDQREIDVAIGNLAFESGQYAKAVDHLRSVAEARPSRQLEMRIVDALTRAGRDDEAANVLAEAMGDSPYDYVALMLSAQIADSRGMRALDAGDDAEARKQFETYRANVEAAARQQPSSIAPMLALAEFLIRQYTLTGNESRLDEALSVLDRAENIDAGRPETRIARSDIYRVRQQRSAAVNELRSALDDSPESLELRRSLINLLVQSGNIREAVKVIEDAIERNPTVIEWHRRVANLYATNLREYEQAAAAFESAYALSDSKDDLRDAIDSLLRMDRVPYRRVLSMIEPFDGSLDDNIDLMTRKAEALYAGRRRDEARAMLRRAFSSILATMPDDSGPTVQLDGWIKALDVIYPAGEEEQAEALVMEMSGNDPNPTVKWMLARFLATRDDVDRALALLTQSIDESPDIRTTFRIRRYLDLAGLYVRQEAWDDAIALYKKVLELQPENVICLNNIAYMYTEKLNDPSKALSFAQRAVAIAPQNADNLDTLGWTYFQLGQFDEAEDALLRSIRANPTASAYVHLGRIYLRSGDVARARTNLDRARTLRPNATTQQEIDELASELARQ